MLLQVATLNNAIWNVRMFLLASVLVRLILAQLLHAVVEVLNLLLDFGRAVILAEVVRKHWLPLICHIIMLQPYVADAHKVARMIKDEVQELLLDKSIAVALHDGTLGHALHVGKRIISLALTSLGCLQRCVECTVLVRQVSVSILSCLLVKATKRNVILIHGVDVVIGFLAHQAAFVSLLQGCTCHGIDLFPKLIRSIQRLIRANHG